jgi:hypothetical protein
MCAVRRSQVGTNLCSLGWRLFPSPDDVGGVRVVRIINRKAKLVFVPLNYPGADDATFPGAAMCPEPASLSADARAASARRRA